MKCSKSTFNAQDSRLIIIALQVGVVKIYATTVEALKKKKKKRGNPVPHTNKGPPTLEC